MYRVTLTYMGTIRQVFICDWVSVNADTNRIWYGDYFPESSISGPHDSGWTLDGNTRIEVEPAEENA